MFSWYGLIVGIAIVVGWSVAEKIEPKVNKVMPLLIIGGLIGARAYHVIDKWEYYSLNPAQIIAIWNGGLGILGAIVGGLIALQFAKIDKWRVLGAVVTGLPLAQAIGRLGNWANQELYGKNGEPLFLYESVLNLLLFAILWRMRSRWGDRRTVAMYALGYGAIRLSLEHLRVEAWSGDYLVAGGLVVVGIVLLLVSRPGLDW